MDKQSQRANDFAPDIQNKPLPLKIAHETLSKLLETSACPSTKLAPNTTGVNGISISTCIASRADLVLQQQGVMPGWTNDVVIKIHGNKMRVDSNMPGGRMYQIVDLITHDFCMVMPEQKQIFRNTSKQVAEAMTNFVGGLSGKDFVPPIPVDIGKAEMVGDLKTKIYNWSCKLSDDRENRQILWVAENFPNYKAIRSELFKLDQFHNSGLDRGMQPDWSSLPGMVVKTQTTLDGKSWTTILISAKVEPVEPSEFEIPSDYTDWKPKVSRIPITTTTNSNK